MQENNILLQVKVIPGGKFNRVDSIVLDDKGNLLLKVRVTAPPSDGKANAAVIKLLSEHFNVAKSCFTLASGITSRHKIIAVHNVLKAQLLKNVQLNLISMQD
jgi:hypothetical protein